MWGVPRKKKNDTDAPFPLKERSTQKFSNKTSSLSVESKRKSKKPKEGRDALCLFSAGLEPPQNLYTYRGQTDGFEWINCIPDKHYDKMNTEWTPAAGLSTSDRWFGDKPLNFTETQFPLVRTQMIIIIIRAITQNLLLKWNLIILVQTMC